MFDLLIKNGRILDGSGLPGFRGNVAVKDGKIVGVGAVDGSASRVIDAEGLMVSPGFIDVHTHYDAQVFWDPLLSSSCWNGVTSVVMGNCGLTLAPCKPHDQQYLAGMLAGVESISPEAIGKGVAFSWTSFPQLLDTLDKPLGINVAVMVGHNPVRHFVMGERSYQAPATQDEIDAMVRIVKEAMAAGAWGFTTSQGPAHWGPNGAPVPSRLATLDEIYQLGMALKESGNGNIELIGPQHTKDGREMLIRLSRNLSRQINWNAWSSKQGDPNAWKDLGDFNARANREGAQIYGVARCQGGNMEFDLKDNGLILLQYTGWAEVLSKPLAERARLLAQPEVRRRLEEALSKPPVGVPPINWSKTVVSGAALDKNRALEGKSFEEIAKERGKRPLDALLDLELEEGLATEVVLVDYANADINAVRQILQSPYAIVGISDAGAHLNSFCGADYTTLFLSRWVRELGVFTPEEAVRKLSFMPAHLMGFLDRGLLKPGMAADINVFNMKTIKPRPVRKVRDLPANESRRVSEADGIAYTVVNGQVAFESGRHTGALSGGLLRSSDYRK